MQKLPRELECEDVQRLQSYWASDLEAILKWMWMKKDLISSLGMIVH
jgi:hypothetical protein